MEEEQRPRACEFTSTGERTFIRKQPIHLITINKQMELFTGGNRGNGENLPIPVFPLFTLFPPVNNSPRQKAFVQDDNRY
jgi:hypothetical protein